MANATFAADAGDLGKNRSAPKQQARSAAPAANLSSELASYLKHSLDMSVRGGKRAIVARVFDNVRDYPALRDVVLDTRAACGDDTRGVMCSINPQLSKIHAEVYALAKQASDHAIPKTGAYNEIWYGEERGKVSEPEEPFYGRTYMPRKFKIGFVNPPSNDIDVYSQDLGFIAIISRGKLKGFNVAIGGGMGRTDQAPQTYPRLARYVDSILGRPSFAQWIEREKAMLARVAA